MGSHSPLNTRNLPSPFKVAEIKWQKEAAFKNFIEVNLQGEIETMI